MEMTCSFVRAQSSRPIASPTVSGTIGVHSEGLSATHCLLSPERLLPLYPLEAMSRWSDRTQSYSL
jgi:hypothetical protein